MYFLHTTVWESDANPDANLQPGNSVVNGTRDTAWNINIIISEWVIKIVMFGTSNEEECSIFILTRGAVVV